MTLQDEKGGGYEPCLVSQNVTVTTPGTRVDLDTSVEDLEVRVDDEVKVSIRKETPVRYVSKTEYVVSETHLCPSLPSRIESDEGRDEGSVSVHSGKPSPRPSFDPGYDGS